MAAAAKAEGKGQGHGHGKLDESHHEVVEHPNEEDVQAEN